MTNKLKMEELATVSADTVKAVVMQNMPQGFGSIFGIKLPFVIQKRSSVDLANRLIAEVAIDYAVSEKMLKATIPLQEYAILLGIESVHRDCGKDEDGNHCHEFSVEVDTQKFFAEANKILTRCEEQDRERNAECSDEKGEPDPGTDADYSSDEVTNKNSGNSMKVTEEKRVGGVDGEVIGTKDYESYEV